MTLVMAGAAVAIAGTQSSTAIGDTDVRASKIAMVQREQADAAARLAGPRLSDAQNADPDPAARLDLQPRTGMVFWRAACPPGPCERQGPPLVDEGKIFATNNYYMTADGKTAWSLYAGWSIADGRGVLRLDRADGRKQIQLPADKGVPTLTAVTPVEALFVTSNGHEGTLDLGTLLVNFSK
jgi:hypothetical protein